jgi:hypothetical protein
MAKFPALHNGYVILALRSQRVGQRVAWGDGARVGRAISSGGIEPRSSGDGCGLRPGASVPVHLFASLRKDFGFGLEGLRGTSPRLKHS